MWVVLACGVDVGYEPVADGHLEYIIQVEPQLLESLAAGHDVTSEVPRGLDIRHFRLTVGTATLPRIAAGAGQPAGAAATRAADAFERPGRADEAVGMSTPQVRVGYQLLSGSSGQYECVIELDPRALGDLNQADLTDDIPPGLPVARFVISTNPGSAPGEKPISAQATLPSATRPVPAAETSGPNAGDGDPSNWQPEVPATTAVTPPPSSVPATPDPVMAVPDDAPGGNVPPPAAMPPHEERSTAPPVSPAQERLDRPGGFSHKGIGAHDEPTPAETPPAADAPPARFPAEATAEPLAALTSGVGDAEPEMSARVARKADTGSASSTEKGGEPGAAERKGNAEKDEASPPKPWLLLAVTVLLLFASLGGNVFLGWVAWDSYNRDRTVVSKIEGRKASLSS
jgi:hypothetical protein